MKPFNLDSIIIWRNNATQSMAESCLCWQVFLCDVDFYEVSTPLILSSVHLDGVRLPFLYVPLGFTRDDSNQRVGKEYCMKL